MILRIGISNPELSANKRIQAKNRKKSSEKYGSVDYERRLTGVPGSYIIFRGNDEKQALHLTDEAKVLLGLAEEIAKKYGHNEIHPAHVIEAALLENENNMSALEPEVLDSGVIETISTLHKLVNNHSGKNMILKEQGRVYLNSMAKELKQSNEAYLSTIPAADEIIENLDCEKDYKAQLEEVQKTSRSIDPYILLGSAFNAIISEGISYPTEFLTDAISYGSYKDIDEIDADYMEAYDSRAIDLWNKLALGSNLSVTYEDSKEADRLAASVFNTLKAPKHGNYNPDNTLIYSMSENIDDVRLLNEILDIKASEPEKQKIIMLNLDHLILNSAIEKKEGDAVTGLLQIANCSDDKLKFVFFQSNDVYYKLTSEPELKTIFNDFMTYAIPQIQTYEAQGMLNKKMLAEVKTPFTKEAKERAIYHAANMQGVFPDKAVDLMKRISAYYSDTKKKITPKDVDEFAQIAYELFNHNQDKSEIVYDTGKTLASMYGKETTKKDIEAIVRQIKTGKIGTRGLLVYSKDSEAGSGRQYTAETIAGEAKVPFISISTSDFAVSERDDDGKSVETPKNAMHKVFSEAKKAARQNQYKTAVVFINNFEEFAFSGPYLPGYKQAMDQLSNEMQRVIKEDVNILVIGSTNEYYAEAIPEVVRGFNQHIVVDSPAFNKNSRREILANKIKEEELPLSYNKLEQREYMINKLVKLTQYMSFVEIKSLVEKTKQIMYERNKQKASMGDFIEAYLQLATGRTSHPEMPDYNKRLTTSHECGHATNLEVMNDILKRKGEPWHQSRDVNFITLDPRGNFLGAVFEGNSDNTDYPFEAMFTALVCAFGGCSCEKLFFRVDGSGGIMQDLAQAAATAKRGIEYLGFGAYTGKISNAASIRSQNYNESVFRDMNVILTNAEIASDLITDCYKKFNEWFTQKYSKLIGSDDCMVDGDDFRRALNNWKKSLPESEKENLTVMDDIIMDIIKASKNGKTYGKIRRVL